MGMPRTRLSLLLAVLAVALGLRIGAAFAVQSLLDHHLHRAFLVPGDAEGYWELGQRLVAGKEYALYEPPRYALRMPGFPLLLSACMQVLGENPLPLRIVLAVIGTFACGLVYRLGRDLCGEDVGILAAALAAVSPMMVGFSVLFLSETFFAVGLLASLIVIAALLRHPQERMGDLFGWGLAILGGLSVAATCYVRPSWLLSAPLFVLISVLLATRRSIAAARGVVFLAALIVALAPWALRNEKVTGHRVWTTLWVGASLYDGLRPGATGASDMRFVEDDGIYHRMSEYNADQYYRRAAWEFVRTHPGETVRLAFVKLWRFWKPWPSADQFSNFILDVLIGGYFILVTALAAIPLVMTLRGRRSCSSSRTELLLFTCGPLLYFSAIHMVFVASLRYRLPAEYAFFVLSAVGVKHLIDRRKRRQGTMPLDADALAGSSPSG